MKAWLPIAGVLALVAVRATGAPPIDLTTGRKLYAGKCARCHKLYDPSSYDSQTWDQWMRKMKSKSRLTEDQYLQLNDYLQTLRSPKAPNE